MDEQKVKGNGGDSAIVKWGDYTLEAHGSRDAVDARFKRFMDSVDALNHSPRNKSPTSELLEKGMGQKTKLDEGSTDAMFKTEEDGIVTLAFMPISTKDQEVQVQEAFLTLLLGFKKLLQVAPVTIQRLTKAIEKSGYGQQKRLTFAWKPLREGGWITKAGARNAAKYALSNPGEDRAKKLIAEWLKQNGGDV